VPTDLESPKLVTLRRFRDLPEALLAKTILDSAAIDCSLADEITIRMNWFLSNALGGIKLRVRRDDADAAAGLLDQPALERFDVEGVGEYQQPRCPNCQSFDISFEELNKTVAYMGLLFNLPIPLKRHGWTCYSCRHEWLASPDPTV
jgi:hypothetical protein